MSWKDIDVLFESDSGGSYEWSTQALVARTKDDGTREYAHYSDGGCSCNYPYDDDTNPDGMAWTTNLREIHQQVSRGIRETSDHYLSPVQKSDAQIKLNRAVQKERSK